MTGNGTYVWSNLLSPQVQPYGVQTHDLWILNSSFHVPETIVLNTQDVTTGGCDFIGLFILISSLVWRTCDDNVFCCIVLCCFCLLSIFHCLCLMFSVISAMIVMLAAILWLFPHLSLEIEIEIICTCFPYISLLTLPSSIWMKSVWVGNWLNSWIMTFIKPNFILWCESNCICYLNLCTFFNERYHVIENEGMVIITRL